MSILYVLRFRFFHQHSSEETHTDACSAACDVIPIRVGTCWPSDIEMDPRIIGESLEEEGSRDRAAPAAARILHVRPIAANQVPILVPNRKPPRRLTGRLACINQLLSQLIIRGEQAGRLMRQGDDGSSMFVIVDGEVEVRVYARKQQADNKPPKAYRELFQVLKQLAKPAAAADGDEEPDGEEAQDDE